MISIVEGVTFVDFFLCSFTYGKCLTSTALFPFFLFCTSAPLLLQYRRFFRIHLVFTLLLRFASINTGMFHGIHFLDYVDPCVILTGLRGFGLFFHCCFGFLLLCSAYATPSCCTCMVGNCVCVGCFHAPLLIWCWFVETRSWCDESITDCGRLSIWMTITTIVSYVHRRQLKLIVQNHSYDTNTNEIQRMNTLVID